MTLLTEAIDLLLSGKVLTAPLSSARGRLVRLLALPIEAEPQRWAIDSVNSEDTEVLQPDRITRVERVYQALQDFEDRVGRDGLAIAVSKHRYGRLFPHGSSLSWKLGTNTGHTQDERDSS